MTIDVPRSGQAPLNDQQVSQDSKNSARDAKTGLGAGAHQQNSGRHQQAQEASVALFAEQLKSATQPIAADKPTEVDIADSVTIANATPMAAPVESSAAQTKSSNAHAEHVVQKIASEVQAAERVAGLSGQKSIELKVPLVAPQLGIQDARLVIGQGELVVTLNFAPGADKAVLAAAIVELTMSLQNRFPNRTIRLSQESDEQSAKGDEVEFNPYNQPVKRRTQ